MRDAFGCMKWTVNLPKEIKYDSIRLTHHDNALIKVARGK